MADHGEPTEDATEAFAEDVLGEESEDEVSGQDYSVAPEELSSDEGGATPHQDIFDSFRAQAEPIITDPEDGLMRPADPPPAPGPLPLSEETMVCLADERVFVEVFAEEMGVYEAGLTLEVKRPWQPIDGDNRPNTYSPYGGFQCTVIARSRYKDDGSEEDRQEFAPGEVLELWGMKVAKKERGDFRFVRPIRPQCAHFHGELSPVDNVADGDGNIIEPMKMHCSGFRTVGGAMRSLFDSSVSACTMRIPQDLVSQERLTARIKKKMAQGRDRTMHPIAKTVGKPKDWDVEAKKYRSFHATWWVPRKYLVDVPSDVTSALLFLSPDSMPLVNGKMGLLKPVRTIVLPDDGWQPEDHHYNGRDTGFPDAKPWGESMTGQMIFRVCLDEPGYTLDSDAALWPASKGPMLRAQLWRQAGIVAEQLSRGEEVAIVSRFPERHGALFASVVLARLARVPGLDAMDMLKGLLGPGLVPNFTHRFFLRSIQET